MKKNASLKSNCCGFMNSDNSLDSRFWGFVPLDDVIGAPMFVPWSWDPEIPFYRLIDKFLSIKPGRTGTVIK